METLLMVLTIFQFGYFFAWSCFGQLFSLAIQQVKYHPQIKKEGGFSLGYWIRDNGWRVIVTLCAMAAGVIFTEQLTGVQITEFTAFLAGFTTDKIIDSLVNRKGK